jgi:excinuclease ABC subunit A
MQARGYVRFRIGSDGQPVEVAPTCPLKKNEKHDIDVVVDRLKVRPDMKQRLAESFEAALRIADGRAIALEMDTGHEHLFSSKFACPVCSYALPELEPRLFSFNSPVGACPHCDGLGQVTVFDPERVVAFPPEPGRGAVKGWDRRNAYTFSLLESVARHYGFDIERPSRRCPEGAAGAAVRLGRRRDRVRLRSRRRGKGKQAQGQALHPFEGIIPNFERRFRETDSAAVREELARYQAAKPAPPATARAAARGAPRVPGAGRRTAHAPSPSTRSNMPRWPRALAYFEACSCKAPRPRSPTRSCARSAAGCAS